MREQIAFVLGTRPEIIKLSPLISKCRASGIAFSLIHTGQHYSESMDSVFFDQLDLPSPTVNLGVGSGSHAEQTGKMLIEIGRVLDTRSPETVLVQGDTNSVLAGAMAASKEQPRVGHVEAGLRSFDPEMPEEINRIVADHLADVLFAPTKQSQENLLNEGIESDRIAITGNTIVDAIHRCEQLARESSTVLSDLRLHDSQYFVMTIHREENVDDRSRLRRILDGVQRSAAAHDVEVVYPIHPRTKRRVTEFSLPIPERIRVIEPLDYLDFIRLESESALILTDSGGVQEEACTLGVPCVTIRPNTERPETIAVGANRLTPPQDGEIPAAVSKMLDIDTDWENPYGSGNAAEEILARLGRMGTVSPR